MFFQSFFTGVRALIQVLIFHYHICEPNLFLCLAFLGLVAKMVISRSDFDDNPDLGLLPIHIFNAKQRLIHCMHRFKLYLE